MNVVGQLCKIVIYYSMDWDIIMVCVHISRLALNVGVEIPTFTKIMFNAIAAKNRVQPCLTLHIRFE